MPSHPESSIASLSSAARALWAKSGDEQSRAGGEELWLSLPQHMVDSTTVASSIWETWTPVSVKRRLAGDLHLGEADAGALVAWLAGVHDIGKATLAFQSQLEPRGDSPQFMQRLRDAGLPCRPSASELQMGRLPHALASGLLVMRWLLREGLPPRLATRLAGVADAHHGRPSAPAQRGAARAVIEWYERTPEWSQVHAELLDLVATLTGIREILPNLPSALYASTQMLLAGHVIMADWIASNADVFPLTPSGIAGERRERGLQAVGLTAPWAPGPVALTDLDVHLRDRFAWPPDASARPVQRIAAEVCAALEGPSLVIIEAPTGEGKTEAALTAAEILAHRSGAGGVMVAAPTMATADGLFRRVLDWSRNAATDSALSMHLGHSKSMLNSTYRELPFQAIGSTRRTSGETVVASQWMSGRKKGILSNVTVATVDQVLFMALQAKHSMLRHLGLAGKVVIIDEVHAYDVYMSAYLRTALEWLARYGASVVLLSATLPSAQKRSLVEAYAAQVGAAVPDELSTAYPLVTGVEAGGVGEHRVAPRGADLCATVSNVEDNLSTLVARLTGVTADGGCVLVVCNTVRRAQETYARLREEFPGEVELHHAAFVSSHRIRKEERLREQLGPGAHRGSGRPGRRFVVATQVAEQSLDIDVDLLVTDIAPIDLLIQRIGRLHRHARPSDDRPPALRRPQVLVRGIESAETPAFDAGARAVYGDRALLASLAVLLDSINTEGFTRPDDIAPLVQRAYGDEPPIPASWSEAWNMACQAEEADRQRSLARSGTYRIVDPCMAKDLDALFGVQSESVDTEDGEARGLAQVRDTDPSIEVIPIVCGESGYRPLGASPDEAELIPDHAPSDTVATELAADTVRLPSWIGRDPAVFLAVLDQLERTTPPGWQQSRWLRGQLALPLDVDRVAEVAGRRFAYDDELGLRETGDLR